MRQRSWRLSIVRLKSSGRRPPCSTPAVRSRARSARTGPAARANVRAGAQPPKLGLLTATIASRRRRARTGRPRASATARPQSRRATRAIAPNLLHHRCVRHPELLRHRVRAGAAIRCRTYYRQHQVRRPAPPMAPYRSVSTARSFHLSMTCHLSSPQLPAGQANWRASARTLIHSLNAH
jgi:hypothetical protein